MRLARLHSLGFSRQKARALLALARAVDRGDVDLERLSRRDDQEAVSYLRELHGVGRWTAEYVLLRGLGRLQVFPGDDVGAQKSLGRWLGRPGPLTYEDIKETAAPWQPYAGMVYFHLLLHGLEQAGSLSEPAPPEARENRHVQRTRRPHTASSAAHGHSVSGVRHRGRARPTSS